LIVSVGADFLGWQGGGYDSGYAKGRIPQNRKMSRHFQLEANMTLSGAAVRLSNVYIKSKHWYIYII
jgi:molybdopterin-containing oxidoreductase family iron-sulfur binding subunit